MPMSRGPALLQHISSNKVPLPMPCTNPCRAIHRSPPAARARPWRLICQAGGGQAQAGSGLRLRRHFCSFVWPAGGLPSPVTHADVTSLSFPPPSSPLLPLPRFLVISGLISRLTNHTLPVARPHSSHSHSPATHCLPLLFLPLVLFIDQHIQLAARHGHNPNRLHLRTPL